MDDVDRRVLSLEKLPFRYAGSKEQAIHDQFGWSPARYYQRLSALLDDPDAYWAEPMLIKRLRRVRERNQADRTSRRLV